MNKEQAIEKLKEEQVSLDSEASHVHADNILCDFLTDLGYPNVVVEFKKINKWYA